MIALPGIIFKIKVSHWTDLTTSSSIAVSQTHDYGGERDTLDSVIFIVLDADHGCPVLIAVIKDDN